MASSDLNATLLAWPPGHELVEDTNSELDVLLIVVEGRGVARVDEQEHALVAGSALLVEESQGRSVPARTASATCRFIDAEGPLQITATPETALIANGSRSHRAPPAATDSVGTMKRSKALRALSHQHHQGLFAALQLKRARRETAVEARQVFLDFYERDGSRHFRAEEELLLPAFARHADVDDPAIVRRAYRARRLAWSRAGTGAQRGPQSRRRSASSASGSRATFASRSASLPDDRRGSAGR